MKITYVMREGKLVEKTSATEKRLQLMRDLEPYQNIVDRKWITGRRQKAA